MSNSAQMPPLPDDLKDRVMGAVREVPAPTRKKAQVTRMLLFAAAAAGLLVTFVLWGGFREWGAPRQTLLIVLTAIGAALIAGVSYYLAAHSRSMVGPSNRVLIFTAVGTTAVLLAWKLGWTAAFPCSYEIGLDRMGLKCLALGSTMGSFPLLAMLWLRRRGEPNHAVLLGVAFGVVAGAFAWVFTDLWCPVGYLRHLMIGHVGPIAILAVGGGLLGAFALSMKPYKAGG